MSYLGIISIEAQHFGRVKLISCSYDRFAPPPLNDEFDDFLRVFL